MTQYSKQDRRDTYQPERDPLDPAILERARGESLGQFGGFDLRLVDAAAVRDWVDVDFTNGGNPSRYAYVPLNEVWVDVANMTAHPLDGMQIALHEVCEAILMEKDGLPYDAAHDAANVAERAAREQFRNGEAATPASPAEALTLAASWLKDFGSLAFEAAKAPKETTPDPSAAVDNQPEPGSAADQSAADQGMDLAGWVKGSGY